MTRPIDWDSYLGETEQLQADLEAEKAAQEEEVSTQVYSKEESISLAEKSVNFLGGLAMPTVFSYFFPPVLLAVWQLLVQVVHAPKGFPQIALGIPRGHGKTTLIKLFILYCILFTNRKFILIVCSTATHAENIIADVFDFLEEPNIKRLFGDWKLGLEKNTNELKKFGFRGRSVVVAGLGVGGSIRGLNIKNDRPDVIVFEDIQTKEASESKTVSDSIERWMYGTAMKAKSPRRCITIFCGNMYPGPNSILKKLKNNSRWDSFTTGAILADGTALWEELRPLSDLLDELDNDIEAGHPEVFFSEVLNDTDVGVNTSTDLALIRDWKWDQADIPQGKAIIIDPSPNKTGGDDCAIGYMEVFDGTCAMRQVIEENLSPGNTIRRALLMALQTGTRLIVVEGTAYQSSLMYWFGVISEQLQLTGFNFVDIYPGNHSKNSRIATMLKSLTAGEIYIHPSIKSAVIYQIANWQPLRRNNVDGTLDLLCYMQPVVEQYGHLMLTDEQEQMLVSEENKVQEHNSPF
jgi:hypothetical protein